MDEIDIHTVAVELKRKVCELNGWFYFTYKGGVITQDPLDGELYYYKKPKLTKLHSWKDINELFIKK